MSDSAPILETIADQRLEQSAVEALVRRGRPVALVAVDLEEVDLSRLDLTGWTFERCIVRNAGFKGARLERTRWTGCRGAFADFTAADLTEAHIRSGDFNNAILRGATLTEAKITGCKLTGVDLAEAKTLGAVFEETLLIAAKLPGFSFRKATLRQLDLGQADLKKADFRDAVFEDCSLRDANLAGARFQGADLRGCDLGGLRLADAALFRGATISRAQAGAMLAELGLNVR